MRLCLWPVWQIYVKIHSLKKWVVYVYAIGSYVNSYVVRYITVRNCKYTIYIMIYYVKYELSALQCMRHSHVQFHEIFLCFRFFLNRQHVQFDKLICWNVISFKYIHVLQELSKSCYSVSKRGRDTGALWRTPISIKLNLMIFVKRFNFKSNWRFILNSIS